MQSMSVCVGEGRRIVLREVVACPGHAGAAVGFGLGVVAQTLSPSQQQSALLWVREAAAAMETGDPYGPGLALLGLPPEHVLIARLQTRIEALRAALEGARCAALSAVVLETVAPVDLTASRRLKLAAEKSGVTIMLIRLTDCPMANAAQIRWRVEAAPRSGTSTDRWGAVFDVTVLKHPVGLAERRCIVEWDHDRRCFAEALPVPVAAVPAVGSLAA
jgi:protein ImuA